MKKLGLLLSGAVLIGIFLAWMLFKGTASVRSWIADDELLGMGLLAVAWLCLLGGAALVARAVYTQPSGDAGDRRRPEAVD